MAAFLSSLPLSLRTSSTSTTTAHPSKLTSQRPQTRSRLPWTAVAGKPEGAKGDKPLETDNPEGPKELQKEGRGDPRPTDTPAFTDSPKAGDSGKSERDPKKEDELYRKEK